MEEAQGQEIGHKLEDVAVSRQQLTSIRARREAVGVWGEEGLETCVGGKHCRIWRSMGCEGWRQRSTKEGSQDSSLDERRSEWLDGRLRARVSLFAWGLTFTGFRAGNRANSVFPLPGGRLPVFLEGLLPNCPDLPRRRQELYLEQHVEGLLSFALLYLIHLRWFFSASGYSTQPCTMRWKVPFSGLKKCYKIHVVLFLITNKL